MPQDLILIKAVVLLKVLSLIALLFYFPGFMLREILNRYVQDPLEGGIGIDFSLGYSIMLIPGLIALYCTLSWMSFFVLWGGVLLVISAIYFRIAFRRDRALLISLKNLFHDKGNLPSQIIAYSVLVFTFIVLFLKGGHFIGDQQHHLAYIIKLLHRDLITPWVSMYEGVKEIPYNYAYDVNFLFSAILVKLSKVDLNLYWDVSPALYFIVSFSAFTYFYRLIMSRYDSRKFYGVFVIGFMIYQLINWDRKLDFEFMPIPDQFSRNIFLPLLLALIVKYGTVAEKNRNSIYYIFGVLFLASIMYTHLYSYMVVLLIGGAYAVVNTYSGNHVIQKIRVWLLYLFLAGSSLFLFVLRTYNSTFYYYSRTVSNVIDDNLITILLGFTILISVALLLRGKIEDWFSLQSKKKWMNNAGIVITIIILCSVFFAILKYNHIVVNTVKGRSGKYSRFISDFSFPGFMYVLVGLPFLLALMRKKIKMERSVLVFLLGTSFAVLITMIPMINIILSKFFTTVYIRRFVFLNDIYFGNSLMLCIASIGTVLSGKLHSKARPLFVLLLLFLSVPLVFGLLKRFEENTVNREYILSEDNVFSYIRGKVEPWSVIASYKYAAMEIVAQSPNYFVSSETVHSPKVKSERARKIATSIILQFKKPIVEILKVMSEYNVGYVLTEKDNSGQFAPVYDLKNFNEKASLYPEVFEIVYVDDLYILYKIHID